MMKEIVQERSSEKTAGAYVFVSIYLVLLAFFVVLLSISIQVEDRQKKVLSSVNKAFTDDLPPSAELSESVLASRGAELEQNDPLSRVGALFQEIHLGMNMRFARDNRALRIEIPNKDFFYPGRAVLHPDEMDLFPQLANVLTTEYPGRRLEMSFTIGSRTGTSGEVFNPNDLTAKRAFYLVTELVNQGVSPSLLSSGYEGSGEEVTILTFNLRQVGKTAIHYGGEGAE